MAFKAQDLCDRFSQIIICSRHTNGSFSKISSVENYDSESLIFVGNLMHLDAINRNKPAVIITSSDLAEKLSDQSFCVITVNDVRLAQALIKQAYGDYDSSDKEWGFIHPSAVIHTTAELGKNVRVGPNSVISSNVQIGDNTIIRANCVIERGAKLGASCIIHHLVNIGIDCVLGERVIVRPGAIIGNEGFGFAQDSNSCYQRIPHTGIVEIGDDVQIGANCNIDRGTYNKTVIHRGVKIDALCHVAHNVTVGENTLFVAQTGVAGSSSIGKRVVASGQTGMLDHRTVVDDVILVHRCGVTEDILKPGMWAGTPPKPFKEYVRELRAGKRLAKLQQELEILKDTKSN
ncbi:MAG: UDP-3-O-(3-hydroxymyristoyl)glucosamine N-acyltransferase [Acidiferrobacterales bacterium]|nr:UDP-3-O-(3-hydroxymyristoyl)glucosamine N-acyltransferase [Acidiferrobacterales bacterium]